jgi:GT2 family glycosyltransferase
MAEPAHPRLSVVIPTRDRPGELSRCLERLERQAERRFEVLVVSDRDESEPHATVAAIGARTLPVRHLTGTGPGASGARNAGWRAAQAPVVLFLGDDLLASPRLVEEHLRAHDEHPEHEVGVLGGVEWARELRVTPFMRWLDRGVQFDFGAIEGEEAGWGRFYTANASVKRELLEAVGGFDEGFPYLYEDLDLAKRMHDEHGFRLLYRPRARGEHLHAVTLESYRGRMATIARMERRFAAKHPGFEPYFHELFARAAAAPPARGRGARLAARLPRGVPWLGPRVWASADAWFAQQLAPAFLEAWDAAGEAQPPASSGGSPPGGPK